MHMVDFLHMFNTVFLVVDEGAYYFMDVPLALNGTPTQIEVNKIFDQINFILMIVLTFTAQSYKSSFENILNSLTCLGAQFSFINLNLHNP